MLIRTFVIARRIEQNTESMRHPERSEGSGELKDDAIAREKQIKGWLRTKKIQLIETMNPHWSDLYEKLF